MKSQEDEISLVDIYRTVKTEWKTLAACSAVSFVGAIFVAFLLPSYYRAEVVLVPVVSGAGGQAGALARQFGGLASIAGLDLSRVSQANELATPYLQSRKLVEEFIVQNGLVAEVLRGDPSGSLWVATKSFMDDVVDIVDDQRLGVVRVSVEWTDPQVAAQWANELVQMANDHLRERELNEAERNVEYLKAQISGTSVVGIQQALFNLIESEMNTIMLANARREYAFRVIDPAVAPEKPSRPVRSLIALAGLILGAVLGFAIVVLRRLHRVARGFESNTVS